MQFYHIKKKKKKKEKKWYKTADKENKQRDIFSGWATKNKKQLEEILHQRNRETALKCSPKKQALSIYGGGKKERQCSTGDREQLCQLMANRQEEPKQMYITSWIVLSSKIRDCGFENYFFPLLIHLGTNNTAKYSYSCIIMHSEEIVRKLKEDEIR